MLRKQKHITTVVTETFFSSLYKPSATLHIITLYYVALHFISLYCTMHTHYHKKLTGMTLRKQKHPARLYTV